MFADDYGLAFAYRMQVPDPDWDGNHVTVVEADETLRGHRLYSLGLKPYAAFEVVNSA